jgi:hypothetical protein
MASRSVMGEELMLISDSMLISREELLRVLSGVIRVLAVYSLGVPRTTTIPTMAPMPHALSTSFREAQTFRSSSNVFHVSLWEHCVIYSLFYMGKGELR